MAPTIIPQDVLNTIIDKLVNDRPTLKACAFVSRFFRYASQAYLFNNLCLRIDEEGHNRQLLDILIDHPALTLCVQSLDLQLLYLRWEPPSGKEHEPIITILSLLCHIQSLRMVYDSNYMLAWKGSGELHEAVMHLFDSPALTHLSLGCIQDFPMDFFLRRCTRLRVLTLTRVYQPPDILDNELSLRSSLAVTPTFHLDTLKISSIQNSGRLLRCLTNPNSSIGMQQLRKFEFGPVECAQDIEDCQNALEGCATTLEIFKVSVASEALALGNVPTQTIDLSRASRLRKLTLEVDASKLEALPWIHALLHSVSLPNNIEEVAIHDVGLRGTGINLRDRRWSAIDTVIASWASPCLHCVSLVIGQYWEPTVQVGMLEETFPGLSLKGILTIASREPPYSNFSLI